MDFKKVFVTFLAIAGLLLLTATASAYSATTASYHNITIKVNGDDAATLPNVVVGDTITVQVKFTANAGINDNIKVRATLEGDTDDVTAVTSLFDVEANGTYSQTLTLKVPSDFESDSINGDFPLSVKIGDEEISLGNLHVQRDSYNAEVMSLNVDSSIKAGQVFPVEVVLKNTGYNDLQDMSVTAKITALGIQKTAFFGDLVNVAADNSDNNDVTTVSGKLYLTMPFGVQSGTYTLEVTASNDKTSSTVTQQIAVQNDFPQTVMQTSTGLLIVNPTNDLKVYKVVFPDSQQLVTVQAGSTQAVDVKANTENYAVSVTDLNGQALGSFTFNASQQQPTITTGSPVVVLTVILGIVFLVLLVVLIVLVSRRPKKSEELGESYY